MVVVGGLGGWLPRLYAEKRALYIGVETPQVRGTNYHLNQMSLCLSRMKYSLVSLASRTLWVTLFVQFWCQYVL